MHDVITIGAATRDAFIRSSALELHPSATDAGTIDACFPLGAKIEIDELIMETGGGATNTAVTFGRLGFKAGIVAAVGNDGNGRHITSVLRDEGVSTSMLQTQKDERTGYSAILLSGTGERTILVYRGAAEKIDAAKIPWTRLKARWFYISSVGGNMALMRKILAHAAKIGAKVAWNPGSKEIRNGIDTLGPLIKKVDVFNLNKEEAALLAAKSTHDLPGIVKTLCPLPRLALLVTDGGNGTTAAKRDGRGWHSGTLDVKRINSTGAGDAFGSGFVAGLLRRPDDIPHALAVGTLNATGVVQQMGAKRGLLRKYPSATALKTVPLNPWP